MKAIIGVIGGSGFYDLLGNPKSVKVETPFGPPSAKISLGEIHGRQTAFLPRHGSEHELPPGKIPYKANLWALRVLGVERVIGVTACGSLQKKIKLKLIEKIPDKKACDCDQALDEARIGEGTYFI